MITIFQKLKTFWITFWRSIKQAYNTAFEHPVKTAVQKWRETEKINLLDIFVSKLNNLCNTEATFEIESDSTQAEPLKALVKSLEDKRFKITADMLADGDCYVFPAHNSKGEIIHTYLSQEQVRIINTDGENITELAGLIDWYIDKNNKIYYLMRNHKLDKNGKLTVSYKVVNDRGDNVILEQWDYINGQEYEFINANHIGVGRYKSPISDRGLSPVYGVPLNFGCADIEAKIFNDLKLIEDEFKNAQSKIFADPLILKKNEKNQEYDIPENVFPITSRPNQPTNIDIFNPTIRSSEYYSKLVADMALYEKQIGTSKGILTDNETTETATATAVKRANSDTISLLDKIRNAIDIGNEMTLQADAVFLNIASDLWNYTSDWYDPFEDPSVQWQRLLDAKQNGAAEDADLVKWLFPSLSADEIEEKIIRINEQSVGNTDNVLERMLGGA